MKKYLFGLFLLLPLWSTVGAKVSDKMNYSFKSDSRGVKQPIGSRLFDSQKEKSSTDFSITNLTQEKNHFEIPEIRPSDKVIYHSGYSLLYNETHEQSNWIAYELTDEETIKQFNRTNKFLVDPDVSTHSANDEDYKGSGYDRGHLAPASDMGWSENTMKESFYYSNMSPQKPSFNRGIWKKLEEKVRSWAVENKKIYIVTGPILTIGLSKIGRDHVSVPKYFYKVIIDYTAPSIKGIAFVMPNESSKKSLQSFAVTIDSVEHITGINFFPTMQDTAIENTLCISCWSWGSKAKAKSKNGAKLNVSVQCSGITKKGARCKRKTTNPSGKCFSHQHVN